jgi:hypothetical protein
MKTLNFVFINSLSKEDVKTIEDVLSNERLRKYLWLEFILNPEMVKACKSYTKNPIVKDGLTDALSWYLAFRWILPENKVIEELHKDKIIKPYRIKLSIYREKRRNFLKGLIHARLC